MGVRGLNTFMNRNSLYFQACNLTNSHVIIDGYVLALHLYSKANCWDCFGGDWDTYADVTQTFFDNLKRCNILSIVVVDGATDKMKLERVSQKLCERVKKCYGMNSVRSQTVEMPFCAFGLFEELISGMDIKMFRSYYGREKFIANLAVTIDCPVLSKDSDFFFFDIKYIPIDTLSCNIETEGECDAIACRMYNINTFLRTSDDMSEDNFKLLAVLGNNQIDFKVFKRFFESSFPEINTHHAFRSDSIAVILTWLKSRTYTQAIEDILLYVDPAKHDFVRDSISIISNKYKLESSSVLNDLDLSDNIFREYSSKLEQSNVIKAVEAHFPEWFLENYCKGKLPSFCMNLALDGYIIPRPLIENVRNKPGILICVQIIKAMHKILTKGESDSFIVMQRNFKGTKIIRKVYSTYERELPILDSIYVKDTRRLLLKILGVSEKHLLFTKLSADWTLFALSILYWKKRCHPNVLETHIAAILMSSVILNVIDTKIGYCRSKEKLQTLIDDLNKRNLEIPDTYGITRKECLVLLLEFLSYDRFLPNKNVISERLSFDIEIIDIFARLQYCMHYIKELNSLLNWPFETYSLSSFYNGTLIYNIYVELQAATNSEDYVRTMFTNAPSLKLYFDNLYTICSS